VAERHGLAASLARLGRPFQHLVTLLVVLVAWVFFRADTLDGALGYLGAMAGLTDAAPRETLASLVSPRVGLALAFGAVGATPWSTTLLRRFEAWLGREHRAWWRPADVSLSTLHFAALQLVLLLCAMELAAGTHNPFIYFRF